MLHWLEGEHDEGQSKKPGWLQELDDGALLPGLSLLYPSDSSGETNKAVPDRHPDDLERQGELFHRVKWLLNLFGGCLLPAGRTPKHRYWFLAIHRLAPRVRRPRNRHGAERGSFLAAHRLRRCLVSFTVSTMSASPTSLVGSKNSSKGAPLP